MKWISVKDELPEEYKWVIVNKEDNSIFIGRRVDGDSFQIGMFSQKVTHWMLLPEPPKD